MTILITGGAKNGKSDFAQDLAVSLAGGAVHYYLATMIPCDAEDHYRIKKHLESRAGLGFETIECGRNILSCLNVMTSLLSLMKPIVRSIRTWLRICEPACLTLSSWHLLVHPCSEPSD